MTVAGLAAAVVGFVAMLSQAFRESPSLPVVWLGLLVMLLGGAIVCDQHARGDG